MSKRRWMALETLLTFWPPAPWARIALKWSSVAAMVRALEMTSMDYMLETACSRIKVAVDGAVPMLEQTSLPLSLAIIAMMARW